MTVNLNSLILNPHNGIQIYEITLYFCLYVAFYYADGIILTIDTPSLLEPVFDRYRGCISTDVIDNTTNLHISVVFVDFICGVIYGITRLNVVCLVLDYNIAVPCNIVT